MEKLERLFDISPSDIIQESPSGNLKPIESCEPEDSDFEFCRNNYYEIIQHGQHAILGALRVASETESPRAYETLGMLMKNMADINKQLLQIGKDKQDVKIARKSATGVAPQQITQNNTAVFVGNSADINKMLKERTKNEI